MATTVQTTFTAAQPVPSACLVCTAPGDFGPANPCDPRSGVCPSCIAAGLERYRPVRVTAAEWIGDFHRSALAKAGTGAMELTDAHHAAIDRAAAEHKAARHGLPLDQAHADQVLSTAIHAMGKALELSGNPASTLNALRAALELVSEGQGR